jgi:uncharacterized Ntn-hydrolase superfamily protein
VTYSIVARDPQTGHMGIATHSHAFAVGSSVPWAEAGVGLIATQSIAEPFYGDLGLALMRGGLTAPEALTALRRIDPYPGRRQVAMVDADGGMEVYTGDECVAHAGHHAGEHHCTLANMMASPESWQAMSEAYLAAEGQPLALRLLDALDAAEAAGGDLRGQRSAALEVVRSTRTGRPWQDRVVDLRVDEHRTPVAELRRLVEFSDNYHRAVRGWELSLDGEPDRAVEVIDEIEGVAADDPDVRMRRGMALALAGREDEAVAVFEELRAHHPQFLRVLRRFPAVGLFPDDPDLLDRLTGGVSD